MLISGNEGIKREGRRHQFELPIIEFIVDKALSTFAMIPARPPQLEQRNAHSNCSQAS